VAGGIHAVWSEDEIAYLLEKYKDQSAKEIATALGRPYAGVVQKLYKYRLSTTGRQLREIVINPKIQVQVEFCNLPVFHPVMVGIYPNREYQGGAHVWKKRRLIVLKMHDWCCIYCGDYADTVDHVIPVEKGGLDLLNNLVAACQHCNSKWGTKTKHIKWICDAIHIPHSEIIGDATHEGI
jgi:hypothetical protein